jgi:hypothetical protein
MVKSDTWIERPDLGKQDLLEYSRIRNGSFSINQSKQKLKDLLNSFDVWIKSSQQATQQAQGLK